MRLDRPYTIEEIAEMMNRNLERARPWSPRRLKRHLLRLNEELGGMLLKSSGGATNRRWLVTLAALKRAAPELFEDTRNLGAELDELRGEVEQIATAQESTARAVGQMAKAMAKGRRAA